MALKCIYIVIVVTKFVCLLKAYSHANRTGSPQGFVRTKKSYSLIDDEERKRPEIHNDFVNNMASVQVLDNSELVPEEGIFIVETVVCFWSLRSPSSIGGYVLLVSPEIIVMVCWT